jgi:hypothetical protein
MQTVATLRRHRLDPHHDGIVGTTWQWRFTLGVVVSCLLVSTATGCSERTGTVSGIVTLDGKPLPAGLVLFHPDEHGIAPASGQIDHEGRYSLARAKGKHGAVVGKYHVTVQTVSSNDAAAITAARKYVIPAVYNDPATTPLIAEVAPGDNTLDIDVRP